MRERQDGLAESSMEKTYAAVGRLSCGLGANDVGTRIFGMRTKERSRRRGMKEDVVNPGTHEPADQHYQSEARANRNRLSSIERLHCAVWYVTGVRPVNLTRPDATVSGLEFSLQAAHARAG